MDIFISTQKVNDKFYNYKRFTKFQVYRINRFASDIELFKEEKPLKNIAFSDAKVY